MSFLIWVVGQQVAPVFCNPRYAELPLPNKFLGGKKVKINSKDTQRMYTTTDYSEIVFYQFPKALLHNKRYKNISPGAKIMYMVLRDRQDLSIKNGWVDDDGHIFFYFDVRNLSEVLSCSTASVNKYKKELRKHKLLYETRQGQGKPNKMYILKPETLDMTMNSNYCYTRVAETDTLEYQKLLQSDTELNDTELNDTEDLPHLHAETVAADEKPILSIDDIIFLDEFRLYFGYEHRRINHIPQAPECYVEMYIDEKKEAIQDFFIQYATNDPSVDRQICSIDYFYAVLPRYIANGGEW